MSKKSEPIFTSRIGAIVVIAALFLVAVLMMLPNPNRDQSSEIAPPLTEVQRQARYEREQQQAEAERLVADLCAKQPYLDRCR